MEIKKFFVPFLLAFCIIFDKMITECVAGEGAVAMAGTGSRGNGNGQVVGIIDQNGTGKSKFRRK